MKRLPLTAIATTSLLAAIFLSTRVGVIPAHAQIAGISLPPLPLNLPAWFPAVWNQALNSPEPQQVKPGSTPTVIPQYFEETDATGTVATYQPGGPTVTAENAYFGSLGTNGRTCFTCHQPQSGWAMNPASAVSIFMHTGGADPLFAPVDGANCPDAAAAAKTMQQKAYAASQLLWKGNIRVFIPVPKSAQYLVQIAHDPYGCENSSKYGLPSGVISMYRRVMNATNLTRNAVGAPTLSPQGVIMWDGREPSLQSQFRDATLGHAQAYSAPSDAQINQGVAFESGLFTAQEVDKNAGRLSTVPATGGPIALSLLGAPNVPTPSLAFTQYQGWLASANSSQASINRGETIFNTRIFVASGVSGFNDFVTSGVGGIGGVTLPGPIPVTCSTCHNNLNVGSDVVGGPRHLGIGDNSSSDKSGNQTTATALPPTSDQPLFTFYCPANSIPYFSNPITYNGKQYDKFQTTDPGMGLITGKCADLGKFKVPRLSGLASRAPYFHNGNAASLSDVVNFYNTRFSIGLTSQEKTDLVNFLHSL